MDAADGRRPGRRASLREMAGGCMDIDGEAINWAALRAEYVAGGIGQRALAQKHGVKPGTLEKRAREEGWAALRGAAEARRSAAKEEEPGDGQIALRLRKTLLLKLERAAATIPCDATEMKTTAEDGAVKLLKLRDLTAAYKELVGDLDAEEREQDRVVIDV
ncbi:MAG: hypothetical protein ABS888_01300 [Eubacteriales bacterium]